ncbi:MAG: hypothetical protein A3B47_01190 [Candidatus Levybacteria bacterium RIFCSPLOWO2_01_FULL_39_24]|nr:MAG: hypothetical protein A2800_03225 [Candidatus Levybacteria bacterium RIFCSPHIGHO2_01_FULL_40_16]OGH28602.1 MAG: hypothetical protein A3E12_03120 [Candidatus Levybacteria bacterium RIFCSPHIGHO2_12_FULL_39_9]OGH45992.1 MAG: hypothetical protein A3B47_01190 [Candidatus Levybacteria bacterium RIFCSPLOWO2_01_FULL_39_24]
MKLNIYLFYHNKKKIPSFFKKEGIPTDQLVILQIAYQLLLSLLSLLSLCFFSCHCEFTSFFINTNYYPE